MENISGYLIHQARLEKDWTLDALSHGICSPSYLSKFETGKTRASEQTANLLFERLGVNWKNEDLPADVSRLKEEGFLTILLDEYRAIERIRERVLHMVKEWKYSRDYVDLVILEQLYSADPQALPADLEPYMNQQQLAWQRYLQGRMNDACLLHPWPLFYLKKGMDLYFKGEAVSSLEPLGRAYDLACAEGHVGVMVNSSLYLAVAYGYEFQVDMMLQYYERGLRILSCMGDIVVPEFIAYNIASTHLTLGDVEQAWNFFSTQERTSSLFYHKKAICAERMGKLDLAREALDQAYSYMNNGQQEISADLLQRMLDLVALRLQWPHGEYLTKEAYGMALIDCIDTLSERLQASFARFHMYWLAEWYQANRKYRDLAILYSKFSWFNRVFPL